MQQKRLNKKKAKVPLIIFLTTLFIAIAGVAAYFLLFDQTKPTTILTDIEFLSQHSWEKEDSPTVIWTFRTDGTGEITTNKINYYDMTFSLSPDSLGATDFSSPQTLRITTSWLYELEDSFSFTLDRENNSFKVKNLADEGESVFVPLGTAEEKVKPESTNEEEKEKNTEVLE